MGTEPHTCYWCDHCRIDCYHARYTYTCCKDWPKKECEQVSQSWTCNDWRPRHVYANELER